MTEKSGTEIININFSSDQQDFGFISSGPPQSFGFIQPQPQSFGYQQPPPPSFAGQPAQVQ